MAFEGVDIAAEVADEFASFDAVHEDHDITTANRLAAWKREYSKRKNAEYRFRRKIERAKRRPRVCKRVGCGYAINASISRGGVKLYCSKACCTAVHYEAQIAAADASPLRSKQAERVTKAMAKARKT